MIKEVKEYYVEPIGWLPSLDDCYKAVDIAVKNDCIVCISWKDGSGFRKRLITTSDDAKAVYDSIHYLMA